VGREIANILTSEIRSSHFLVRFGCQNRLLYDTIVLVVEIGGVTRVRNGIVSLLDGCLTSIVADG